MRTATLRTPGLIVALVAMVATLTSCGSGPGQVNSAVIIDGRSISVDEVQALVDKVVREQPAAKSLAKERKLDLVAREAVSQLVVHELVDDVAEEENLSAGPDQVAAFLAGNPLDQELPTDGSVPPEALVQQLVFRARDANEYATDQVLLGQLTEKYLGRTSITYNLVTLTDGDKAKELAERIAAAPDQAGELMTEAGGDTAEPRLDQPSGPTVDAVYLSAPLGSVFVLPSGQDEQQGGGGFQVVQLLDREVADQIDPSFDPSSVQAEQLPALGLFALREAAMTADLEISPRYGVWNDAMVKVVPKLEADVSGSVLLPADHAKP
ncbi:SurA N-terminal domain-containing protein [Actinophytocola sediminis]